MKNGFYIQRVYTKTRGVEASDVKVMRNLVYET